jgi:hypothetical protein
LPKTLRLVDLAGEELVRSSEVGNVFYMRNRSNMLHTFVLGAKGGSLIRKEDHTGTQCGGVPVTDVMGFR